MASDAERAAAAQAIQAAMGIREMCPMVERAASRAVRAAERARQREQAARETADPAHESTSAPQETR